MARFPARELRFAAAAAAVLIAGQAKALDDTLDVVVDRATVVRAPANTATIIIGNPLIADAATQKSGVLVVTGKSFGSTNFMVLDASGAVLSETTVNVRRAPEGLVVQRGVKRESYACAPRCEPVLAIGDNTESFGQTANQIQQRSNLSVGRAE
ncbi:pilus assembly protein N-terminal domain-containing protein [Methylopila sp. M107]|uniref:pilus assembly protein N-terminal domain-containing protein n=1 Tax=Methylopila sp. M107 TaxID=1101190 RepID=UPI00038116E6|nr:pilus assembly protein N-terminal domain-containing protein [Methylopila sp. M107]